MPKVIFEQFDGGLQKDWYKTTSTTRAYKNQKKNGIAHGCTNPFLQEGVLYPGSGSRTAITNEGTVTGSTNNILSMISIGDDNFVPTTSSIYFGQDDDFHAISVSELQTTAFPQTIPTAGFHSGHGNLTIEKIVDYQVNGVRKQLIFWRDDDDWDCTYYSGITSQQGTVTLTQANPGVFTKANHGLSSGDTVKILTSGALPTNITAGTVYYVLFVSKDTFNLATTKGGTAIDTTAGSNTGTHTLYPGLQTIGMGAATNYSSSLVLSNLSTNANRRIVAVVSDNGFCYFGNGNRLHKFDGTSDGGTNGTIHIDALKLSSSREVVDMVDGLGKIWILTRAKSTAYSAQPHASSMYPSVLVWDRKTGSVNIEDNIPINALDAFGIYIHNSIPFVWAKTPGMVNKLLAFDGRKFEPVAEIGSISSSGEVATSTNEVGLPANYSNSVSDYNNGFIWGDRLSNIFWFGSTNPGITAPAVYWISRISTVSGNSGGAVISGGSLIAPIVFTSYAQSNVVKLRYFLPAFDTDTNCGATTYTSAIELPKLSTINGVTIFFNENTNADTGTTTVKIFNSWKKNTAPYMVTKTIDHDVDIPRGWVYYQLGMENSNLVQLSFTYNGTTTIGNSPQITRIEVDYSVTSKKK